MRNEREKNEEKIRRVRWMYKEGGLREAWEYIGNYSDISTSCFGGS